MTSRFLRKILVFFQVAAALPVAATVAFSKAFDADIKARKLPKELGEAFCAGDFSFRNLWKHKIYDAQVEGVLLASYKEKLSISERDANERAKELAQSEGKFGYASGICHEGTGWAVAIPSADPILIKGDVIDLSGMSSCHGDLKLLWVDDERGGSKVLLETSVSRIYKVPAKKNGFISVVCESHDKNKSPIELFLAPIGQPKAEPVIPNSAELLMHPEKAVLNWINSRRANEKLKPLQSSIEVLRTAEILVEKKQVTHNLRLLRDQGLRLKKIGIEIKGENRVRASSLSEALTLLWISPGHRDLLLKPDASSAGIVVKNFPETFVELVLAKSGDEKKK